MLAALLERIWPKRPLRIKLVQKPRDTLPEFMDKVDDFVTTVDTLQALTTQEDQR